MEHLEPIALSIVASIIHRSKEEIDRMGRRRFQAPILKRSETADGRRDRWWFRAYVDTLEQGTRIRVEKSYHVGYCSEMGKREAQSKMAEMVAALNQPAVVLQSQVKFGSVLDKFLLTVDVRPQTLQNYTGNVEKHFRPRWGDIKLCDISVLDVEEWIRAKAKTVAKNTLANLRGQFTQIWNCALRWGLTKEANPIALIPRIRNAGKTPRGTSLPSLDQFHALLYDLEYDVRAFVVVAVGTGMRAGEILALRWRNIGGDVLKIEYSMTPRGAIGPVKTQGSNRLVPIRNVQFPPRPDGKSDDDFIFEFSYDHLRRSLVASAKTIGIHYEGFGAHTFRRMHNTLFRRISNDVGLAQKQLGHSDEKTNDIYYIPDLYDVERRASVVEQMMSDVLETVQ